MSSGPVEKKVSREKSVEEAESKDDGWKDGEANIDESDKEHRGMSRTHSAELGGGKHRAKVVVRVDHCQRADVPLEGECEWRQRNLRRTKSGER